MSEYVRVDVEYSSHPDRVILHVNQTLTDSSVESYLDPMAGEEGSPLAQAIFFGVDGVQALSIEPQRLLLMRAPGTPWELLIDEVRDVLRDFFL